MDSHVASLVLPLGIAVVILIARNSRPRKLRIERLWIRPVLFIAIMAASLAAAAPAPTAANIALLAAAGLLGAALGWQRGRLMQIHIHPETHDLTMRASPIGLVFILVLLVARYGLRSFMSEGSQVLGVSLIAAADAFVLLTVAMMVVQGIEMWLRASRMLAEAQAAKAGGQMPKIIS